MDWIKHGLKILDNIAQVRLVGLVEEAEGDKRYITVLIKTKDLQEHSITLTALIPRSILRSGRAFSNYAGRGIAIEGHLTTLEGDLIIMVEEYHIFSKQETENYIDGAITIII